MIIPINDEFRSQVNQLIADEWAGPIVVTKGVAHDTSDSDGFISVQDGALTGVYIDALDESRKLKPSIPQLGNENIPIQHEFEFSYTL